MLSLVYKCFLRFWLTRQFTRNIERRMNILYPGARDIVIQRTGATLCKVFCMGCVSVVALMCFAKLSLYYMAIMLAMIYVISVNVVYNGLDKIETKMLVELEHFINHVRYRFRFDGMIDEALDDAINMAGYEMSLHGQLILNMLKDNINRKYGHFLSYIPPFPYS